MDVYLTERSAQGPVRVWAVLFVGRPDAEPPGVSNLMGFTRQDLVVRYGGPAFENAGTRDSRYLYFRNGIMVWLEAGKVRSYGVYSLQR